MDVVVYSQTYRTRTPERQLEIDECLWRKPNHSGMGVMVLITESDALLVEVVNSDERIPYAKSFHWAQRQGPAIGELIKAERGIGHKSTNATERFSRPTRQIIKRLRMSNLIILAKASSIYQCIKGGEK